MIGCRQSIDWPAFGVRQFSGRTIRNRRHAVMRMTRRMVRSGELHTRMKKSVHTNLSSAHAQHVSSQHEWP